MTFEPEETVPEEPSKSQLKFAMLALQALGKELVDLPDSDLATIVLPDNLLEAIQIARSLKNDESKRRQMQYIGKIMRDIDPLPIQAALKKLQLRHHKNTTQFHKIEEWRDKLIAEGDEALQIFVDMYSAADRQQLRQLVRKAQHEQTINKNQGAVTALFRFLRTVMQE